MSRTLEQKIAEAEARLQRLKAKSRSLDTAQKVIVGAAMLARVRRPGRSATACVPAPVPAKGSHKTGRCEPDTTSD
ncbi:mobilization protein [Escherichia coli]|uniref:Mobilization protein n=1 Tax=Escherichia coli TaxID=562 RepID=A0A376WQ22_ECOLX|nr:mobilization protein [Escherichia coli]